MHLIGLSLVLVFYEWSTHKCSNKVGSRPSWVTVSKTHWSNTLNHNFYLGTNIYIYKYIGWGPVFLTNMCLG